MDTPALEAIRAKADDGVPRDTTDGFEPVGAGLFGCEPLVLLLVGSLNNLMLEAFGLQPEHYEVVYEIPDAHMWPSSVGVAIDMGRSQPVKIQARVPAGIDEPGSQRVALPCYALPGNSLTSSITSPAQLLAMAAAIPEKPLGVYPARGHLNPLADEWFWSAGDHWMAVVAEWEADVWWEGADGGARQRPDPWRRPIDDLPDTGSLLWQDRDGQPHVESASVCFWRDGDIHVATIEERLTGDGWLVHVKPRDLEDYEGGTTEGAILAPYGDTFWPNEQDALDHLARVRATEHSPREAT